jgi:hypothetical protein
MRADVRIAEVRVVAARGRRGERRRAALPLLEVDGISVRFGACRRWSE